MTIKELAADWLQYPWPLTIHADRYSGSYSGGRYLAWSCDFDAIPDAVNSSDPDCMYFWHDFKQGQLHPYLVPLCVGRGSTIDEAVEDLKKQIRELS